ncbi:SF1B family DNA helicase RecD2 [Natribacillus halophilus]|uniref:ATP-dependent RecD2 DNA helicase n=1 Tax=Natribacillus halophilus TaxID=549003 RepID=A0A1G8P012_9BACI|nr:ATP-dependent RecD-like DNA helicase [Natribacillus halophilus]SDI85705.1 ATP-dependent DNA helicase, RecD/TraA family [Natribacillus halophilus]
MNDEWKASLSWISGTVSHIIFRNDNNGYTVLNIHIDEAKPAIAVSSIAIVGHFPAPPEGEMLTFFGHYHEHPRYGQQFNMELYEPYVPQGSPALIQYLSSQRFPGIGEKTATRVVEALGEAAIEKIINDPTCLYDLSELKREQADILTTRLMEEQELAGVMSRLIGYGFGTELATKIIQKYEGETLTVVEDDPYQLVQDIEGIGFQKADTLGEQLGIASTSRKRVKAGLLFTLTQISQTVGHVYLPENIWVEETLGVLNYRDRTVNTDMLLDSIVELAEEGTVVVHDDRGYMLSLYFAEKGLATNMKRLLGREDQETFSQDLFLKTLGELEDDFKITYAERQKEAVELALKSPLMILTGGPGTGKTTVIRAIVEMFKRTRGWDQRKEKKLPVLLAAPTGRAAKRMAETTGLRAYTIHKWLGWRGEGEEFLEHDEDNPLEGELLIIDEASMVDIWLANQLFKAIPDGMQVVIVGDEDQLPSVGPGQVLGDVLRSETIPAISLSLVYRQAEGSSIIDLAHELKEGRLSADFTEAQPDRSFIPCQGADMPDVVLRVCEKALEKNYSARELQVLVPMYKGSAGIHRLNERLQALFNPPQQGKRSVKYGDVEFRHGDIVLQLVNNPEDNVFNGDRGEIVAIQRQKETEDGKEKLVVSFDGKEVEYEKQALKQITLAYCSSIHKAQGSEFPIVIVPLSMSYRRMLKRNLLYTAITRARDSLIMVGERRAFEMAAQNNDQNSRYSHLHLRLAGEEVSSNHESPAEGQY